MNATNLCLEHVNVTKFSISNKRRSRCTWSQQQNKSCIHCRHTKSYIAYTCKITYTSSMLHCMAVHEHTHHLMANMPWKPEIARHPIISCWLRAQVHWVGLRTGSHTVPLSKLSKQFYHDIRHCQLLCIIIMIIIIIILWMQPPRQWKVWERQLPTLVTCRWGPSQSQ